MGIWKLRGVGKDAENVGTRLVTKMKMWFLYYYNVTRHRTKATTIMNGSSVCDRLMNG